MSDSSYAPPDMTPSARPMAWSEEDSRDQMATVKLSGEEMATVNLWCQQDRDEIDGEWPAYPGLQDLGAPDEPQTLPWYRHPIVLVAAAASVVVIAGLGFVMTTSQTAGVGNVPVGSSIQSTPPPLIPASSTLPPPPLTSTAASSADPSTGTVTYPGPGGAQSGGVNPQYGSNAGTGTTGGGSTQSADPGSGATSGNGTSPGDGTTPGNGTDASGGVNTSTGTTTSDGPAGGGGLTAGSGSNGPGQSTSGGPTNGGFTAIPIIPIPIPVPLPAGPILQCFLKPPPCP